MKQILDGAPAKDVWQELATKSSSAAKAHKRVNKLMYVTVDGCGDCFAVLLLLLLLSDTTRYVHVHCRYDADKIKDQVWLGKTTAAKSAAVSFMVVYPKPSTMHIRTATN